MPCIIMPYNGKIGSVIGRCNGQSGKFLSLSNGTERYYPL